MQTTKRDLTLTPQNIKSFLASCGFNTVGIKIKVEHGLDTEITVRVSDCTVNKKNLEELLNYQYGFQRVDAMGMELSGCNQYIDVY